MNKFNKWFIVAAILLLMNVDLVAQDSLNSCCCCSRPDYHAPIGVMIDHTHMKGEWMVSYRYMNMMMNENISGDNKISKENIYQNYLMNNNSMSMQMHMLMVMYGLSDRITLMGMGNYSLNKMEMSMMMFGNHTHGGSSMTVNMEMTSQSQASGLGDTKLYLLYSLIDGGNDQLVLSAGAGIPTGSVSLYGINIMGDRQKFSYSMQPGTGSWRFLPGITYTIQSCLYTWGVQGLADVKLNMNKNNYKIGNEYTCNAWVGRKWNSWLGNSLRINASAIGKIKGFDEQIAPFRTTEPDADTKNSGGFYTSVNLGLNIIVPEGFFSGNRFGLEYGIPVYQYVNGIQMRKQGFLFAGWQYLF